MQSALTQKPHVGIIMDGNGRWATARGRPRSFGHAAGAAAVRRVVAAAPGCGIGTLTLYAFSADNWQRPQAEVTQLLALLARFLRGEAGRLARAGVRLRITGRRDRMPADLAAAVTAAEAVTAEGTALDLTIAFDHSGRDAILDAARRATPDDLTRDGFARLLGGPPVDLVIRTGGEQRLSDFLLWDCAYAELWFTAQLWPDFGAGDLADAMTWFRARNRRFGGLAQQTAGFRVPDSGEHRFCPQGATAG